MDTCVCCGGYVPEGQHVCMSCHIYNGIACFGNIQVSSTCAKCPIAHDCLDSSNMAFSDLLSLDNMAYGTNGMLRDQLTKEFRRIG